MKRNKVELWYQPTVSEQERHQDRIRILKVGSYSKWSHNYVGTNYQGTCCWDHDFNTVYLEPFKTLKEKYKAMRAFDKKQGWPKAIKIGEWYE